MEGEEGDFGNSFSATGGGGSDQAFSSSGFGTPVGGGRDAAVAAARSMPIEQLLDQIDPFSENFDLDFAAALNGISPAALRGVLSTVSPEFDVTTALRHALRAQVGKELDEDLAIAIANQTLADIAAREAFSQQRAQERGSYPPKADEPDPNTTTAPPQSTETANPTEGGPPSDW